MLHDLLEAVQMAGAYVVFLVLAILATVGAIFVLDTLIKLFNAS